MATFTDSEYTPSYAFASVNLNTVIDGVTMDPKEVYQCQISVTTADNTPAFVGDIGNSSLPYNYYQLGSVNGRSYYLGIGGITRSQQNVIHFLPLGYNSTFPGYIAPLSANELTDWKTACKNWIISTTGSENATVGTNIAQTITVSFYGVETNREEEAGSFQFTLKTTV